jgi:conjugative transfer pilus assembly protein TraH
MIQTYKDVIAADYAATFLTQFANVAVGALQKQYLLTERQQADANSLRGTAQRLTDTVLQEQANMYKKTASISTVASDLERLERNLRANMSAHVMDMLGHAHRGVQ